MTFLLIEHVSWCCLVKEKKWRIWDGFKEKFVTMTDTMMHEARVDPCAYPGCIEEGVDLVLRILTNRVRSFNQS